MAHTLDTIAINTLDPIFTKDVSALANFLYQSSLAITLFLLETEMVTSALPLF